MTTIFETRELTERFGGLVAVDSVSFSVCAGEILGVIGPNGAGKSTLFAMVSGFLRPTSGQIIFEGQNIAGLPAFAVSELGIARVFQQSVVFGNMTVVENVLVGFHKHRRVSLVESILRCKSARREEDEFRAQANEIVESVGLGTVKAELACNLPHGFQRVLSLGVALATGPKLLLLDEPVTGMNASEANHMVGLIRSLAERGMTVILVEHHMRVVMEVCRRVVVLNYGRKIAEGTPDEVVNDPVVREAYLGRGTLNAA